jgi:arylsulfatase A-like enzyme
MNFGATFLIFLSSCLALAGEKPNIVIILADDMGYGDPGCYNVDSKVPTPNLDAIAAGGLKFTDAHAPGPLCHLSRYGLLTGRYPFRKPIIWQNNAAIAADRLTLPAMLREVGYRTAMVGKWHLGFFEDEEFAGPLRGGPVDRGFDSFFGIRASTDIPPYFYIRGDRAVDPPSLTIPASRSEDWSPIQGKFWRAGGIAPGLELAEVTPRFTAEAILIIESHAVNEDEKPLMLYLAYPGPHTPWLPSEDFIGSTKVGLYGDFTHMIDAEIGKVLAALDEAGMRDETLLVFASDNGPVWYQKDCEKFQHDSAGGLRGMKGDAWEGGHRMPFIIRWPARIRGGRTSNGTICFTDLFASLAGITGAKLPDGQAPDSESFLPVLNGEPASPRKAIVMAAARGHFVVRSGNWKLITGPGSGGFSPVDEKTLQSLPKVQLYNLKDDPAEGHNLAAKNPEKVAELAATLKRIQQER